MELKEYLKILTKYQTTFVVVWLAVILVGFLSTALVTKKYRTTFSIDIARDSKQVTATQDYEYDQFYRLEADDRFGRTVVQWLNDEAIVSEIYSVSKEKNKELGNEIFGTKFRAEKLANSYVKVNFLVDNKKAAAPVFLGVKQVLREKTEEFNSGFEGQNRIKLIFNGPTVREVRIPFVPLLIGLIGGGFFLASFGVMLRRYLE